MLGAVVFVLLRQYLLASYPQLYLGLYGALLILIILFEPLGLSGRLKQRVEAYERGLVYEALKVALGNRSEAARRLGISRVTLHDKLKKYGLGGDEEG